MVRLSKVNKAQYLININLINFWPSAESRLSIRRSTPSLFCWCTHMLYRKWCKISGTVCFNESGTSNGDNNHTLEKEGERVNKECSDRAEWLSG